MWKELSIIINEWWYYLKELELRQFSLDGRNVKIINLGPSLMH